MANSDTRGLLFGVTVGHELWVCGYYSAHPWGIEGWPPRLNIIHENVNPVPVPLSDLILIWLSHGD